MWVLSMVLGGAVMPVMDPSKARRAQHVLDTGLAFSRAADAQLWVCLLEKAYAKARGCVSPTIYVHMYSPTIYVHMYSPSTCALSCTYYMRVRPP